MPQAAEPCYYCGEITYRTPDHSYARRTIDHLVPLSLGGTATGDNLVIACGWCNWRKSDMFLNEFVTWLHCIDLSKRDRLFRRKATAVINKWWWMVLMENQA